MEHSHDLDELKTDAIDDPIVTTDDLTKCLVANLRDDAPGQRVGLEMINRRYQAFNE
jgi:hypothetical protein